MEAPRILVLYRSFGLLGGMHRGEFEMRTVKERDLGASSCIVQDRRNIMRFPENEVRIDRPRE